MDEYKNPKILPSILNDTSGFFGKDKMTYATSEEVIQANREYDERMFTLK